MTHYLEQALTWFGAIVAVASTIAPFLARDSKAGQWLAWVASCPIGHQPKKEAPK